MFEQYAGITRFIYNLALEQRTGFWRQYQTATGHRLDFVTQGRQLTQLRAEVDWIGGMHLTPQIQALRDLDKAFAAFFAKRTGYPQFRRKGVNDSFRFKGREVQTRPLNAKWALVRVPKIGWVKFRDTRPTRGKLSNLTIAKSAEGWHVCFSCEIEHDAPANNLPAVGIDRGVANTLALSTGEMLSTPDLAHLTRRKKQAQRVLARRVRGSNRYRAQRVHVSKLVAKIARCRGQWQHEASVDIARRFGVVTLEALKIANMTRSGRSKRGLNRSILEQGWGGFELALSYKLDERGGTLIKVHPAYSSLECSACGVIDKRSRESQALFACQHCGFTDHADTNAAKVILRRSAPRVEDRGCPSVEARTLNLAA